MSIPAHKRIQTSHEPSCRIRLSSFTHLFHQISTPLQHLSLWPAGQKAASAKSSKAVHRAKAGVSSSSTMPRPCLAAISLWFPLLSPSCCQNAFLLQLNKRNIGIPLKICLCHVWNWLMGIALLHNNTGMENCVWLRMIIWSSYIRETNKNDICSRSQSLPRGKGRYFLRKCKELEKDYSYSPWRTIPSAHNLQFIIRSATVQSFLNHPSV